MQCVLALRVPQQEEAVDAHQQEEEGVTLDEAALLEQLGELEVRF